MIKRDLKTNLEMASKSAHGSPNRLELSSVAHSAPAYKTYLMLKATLWVHIWVLFTYNTISRHCPL